MWDRLIRPYHKIVCDAVKDRGAYLSLHSDGNVSQILDGIVDLGYDVLHPFQESAGMSFDSYMRDYKGRFTIMGGLDVQTTIGFGNYEKLEREITRVIEMFKDGNMLFCTSHFVQDHCTIDELVFAYDLVFELVRSKALTVRS
jgi:uroporphyrinogen decarboxylase